MKLLIYSRPFAPMVGGVETVVMALARGLADSHGAADWKEEHRFDVVVATRAARGTSDDEGLPFRVERQPSIANLCRLILESDVVHIAGPALLPLLFCLLLHKPVVIEHHGFQTICPNGLMNYLPTSSVCPGHFMARQYGKCLRCNRRLGRKGATRLLLLTFVRRLMCRFASANIAPTAWLASMLSLSRSIVIPHGLDHADVDGLSPRTVREAPGEPTRFAFVGRLVPTKGVEVLLDAAQILYSRGINFRIEVVGDGPQREALEERAQMMGLSQQIRFHGYLPDEQVTVELEGALVGVMPSVGGEVFGLAALEHMEHGRPVIVSNGGSLPEVVGDAGWIVPAGKAEELADCMERIVCDPQLGTSMGIRAVERATTVFSTASMITAHQTLYERFAGAPSREGSR